MTQRHDEILGVYERVTAIVWGRLAPSFGSRAVSAIARNVIVKRSKVDPLITGLAVGQDGLDFSQLRVGAGDLQIDDLQKSMDAFVDAFFQALTDLIGQLVVGRIFKDAEEILKGAEEIAAMGERE